MDTQEQHTPVPGPEGNRHRHDSSVHSPDSSSRSRRRSRSHSASDDAEALEVDDIYEDMDGAVDPAPPTSEQTPTLFSTSTPTPVSAAAPPPPASTTRPSTYSSASLPRLDDSSRWRASPAPRSSSPPRVHVGPTTVRETREIPLPPPIPAPTTTQRPSTSTGNPLRMSASQLNASRSRLRRTPSQGQQQQQQQQQQHHHQPHTLPLRPAAPTRPATFATPRTAPSPPPSPPPAPSSSMPTSPSHPSHTNPPIQIPKISPLSSSFPPPQTPTLPAQLARGLEGMYVDEFGNVLDWEGHVLGRVEGDLPAMVGRPVSASGAVVGEDGVVAGYVVENETLVDEVPEPRSLDSLAGTGLKVDHIGNILDGEGRVIGHLNAGAQEEGGQSGSGQQRSQQQHHPQGESTLEPPSSRPSAPSPSEIYLDVKSTMDGIQIIMKIPTVFNRDGRMPQVHIS